MSGTDGRALRMIEVVHLIDQGTRSMADDGCDRDGRPNQQRQHLTQMLRKRISVDGKDVPVFRLSKPPPPCNYPNDKGGQACRAADHASRWEQDNLKSDTGDWRMPSPEWRAISDKLKAQRDARAAEVEEQTMEKLKNAAGDAVNALLNASQKQTRKAQQATG